jgi:hypothetical protein
MYMGGWVGGEDTGFYHCRLMTVFIDGCADSHTLTVTDRDKQTHFDLLT